LPPIRHIDIHYAFTGTRHVGHLHIPVHKLLGDVDLDRRGLSTGALSLFKVTLFDCWGEVEVGVVDLRGLQCNAVGEEMFSPSFMGHDLHCRVLLARAKSWSPENTDSCHCCAAQAGGRRRGPASTHPSGC
jgi:hypothetical protein